MPAYAWREAGAAVVAPYSLAARMGAGMLSSPFNPLSYTPMGRTAAAGLELFARVTAQYDKPDFGITETVIDGQKYAVREETVMEEPFFNLPRFTVDGLSPAQQAARPKYLLIAPMSGHFATLLRGTVKDLLPYMDVHITDWANARDVPLHHGRFDLDDFSDALRRIFHHFRGDVHVMAVCQPSVPTLVTTALMEADGDPFVPRSLVLSGGPIDTRISPTEVNHFAKGKDDISWFENHVIHTVPFPHLGMGRPVYPGFLQLTGFLTMNLEKHMTEHKDLFLNLIRGDGESAERHRAFYDEYLAVMDLTAEFYLQTIKCVFLDHALPEGNYIYRKDTPQARRVDLGAIRRVPIMTVEGEKDDITGAGQCHAALAMCRNLDEALKARHDEPGVGHYGVFNGKGFRTSIVPAVRDFVARHSLRHGLQSRLHLVPRKGYDS